jgi:hypothetical protein
MHHIAAVGQSKMPQWMLAAPRPIQTLQACNCALQQPATACNRLQQPATACTTAARSTLFELHPARFPSTAL